jgi:hypothetical protein
MPTQKIKVSSEVRDATDFEGAPYKSFGYYVGKPPDGTYQNCKVTDKSLFPLIVKGKYLNVEYEPKPYESNGVTKTYWHIIAASEAVYDQKGGGKYQPKTPEDRRSIENQVAVYAVFNNFEKLGLKPDAAIELVKKIQAECFGHGKLEDAVKGAVEKLDGTVETRTVNKQDNEFSDTF